MDELAKILEKKNEWWAISFDKVEVKFNLDEAEPQGVYFKVSKMPIMIEEFMLLIKK
jgi:exoribonuclease R